MGRVVAARSGYDAAIARIARGQRGLVTRHQMVSAGMSSAAIAHRVALGRLHRMHRGVYLVGHEIPPVLARELAAVLACGVGAVLSHRSAAALWSLPSAPQRELDVTTDQRGRSQRPGLRVHRVRTLPAGDRTRRHAVPVTTPARTLLDLSQVVGRRELQRAFEEAAARRLVRAESLLAELERAAGRRGSVALRTLIQRSAGPALTRSEAEARLLALVRAADLPPPETNVAVGRYEVDLLWRAQALVVEVDGYAFHSSPAAFERDRLRDARLSAAGLRVTRVTWSQIVETPEALIARLAVALARPTPVGSGRP